jgi:simple sugar transport system ATP-binding protein
LVSAELEEVKSLADRLLVMRKGKIVGELDPNKTSVEEIGLLMTGS